MTFLLLLLLLIALAGLAVVGFFAVQFRITLAQKEAELAAQADQYDQDYERWTSQAAAATARHDALATKFDETARTWQERTLALKGEIQRLAKWKSVADADQAAAEMSRVAQANLDRANAQAQAVLSAAQQRASALLQETNGQATATITSAH